MEVQTHTIAAVVSKPKRVMKKYHVGYKGRRDEGVVVARNQSDAKELYVRAHGHWDSRLIEIL